jgi:hypothetical protein
MGLFDPINWSGWPTFGSVGQDLYESTPNAAYQRLLGQMGLISSQTPFGKFATGQRDDAYNTYLAKLGNMNNPTNYSYIDFLKEWGPQLSTSFQSQSPEQRGERYPGGVPRARWLGFPS